MTCSAMKAIRHVGGTYSKGIDQRAIFAYTMTELVANAWADKQAAS